MNANWSYPTPIKFGNGRITELTEVCKQAGITRPLFVTDAGLINLDIAQNAISLLKQSGLPTEIFFDVQPNPTDVDVAKGVHVFNESGCDGVIAFGGGSALDVGKTIAFVHAQTRPLWDFEDIGDYWTRADADKIAPVVAIPTTAGTGSEVGRAAVITNEATHEKKIIFHPKMLPVTVICDPVLTVGLPPALTAGAGMDALAHCIEAYCAPTFHPMSAGIALEGIKLVGQNLEKAVNDGTNLDARANMMAAASMGAVAFQKGLGAIHSLSHPIGALFGTHHGMTNGVFMPYVIAYNRSGISDKINEMCHALGTEPGYDGLFNRVLGLRKSVGVPDTLSGLGVSDADLTDENIKLLAERAVADPSTPTNPVELTSAGAEQILRAAIFGTDRL